MGCNCGGKNGTGPKTFVYTDPSGKTTEKRTEVEARAAVIRGGGTYAPK